MMLVDLLAILGSFAFGFFVLGPALTKLSRWARSK